MKRFKQCRGGSLDSPKGEPKGSPLRFGLLLALALATTIFTLVPSIVEGAVPKLINFQGILKDGSGNPVANASYSVTFTIYDAAAGGSVQWAETTSVTTSSGLFSVLLGSTNPVPDTAFNNPNRWMGIKVGADPEMTPRQQLVSLGYAYRVSTVDSASGGTITSKVSIGPGHTNTGVNAFVVGENNTATANYATVGGGQGNSASFAHATVGGGIGNTASGAPFGFATVGGGSGNGANGGGATVGGGTGNSAAVVATVGGGQGNSANGAGTTVGGGVSNTASNFYATVGGGLQNTASNQSATAGGGESNLASGLGATIGGGGYNKARGDFSVVGGGGGVTPLDSNSAHGNWSTIGGGHYNLTGGMEATVAGGARNLASGSQATVGGGAFDTASNSNATVSGGYNNTASGNSATVGGGLHNRATGGGAAIGGGQEDTASGDYSTVPGGYVNKASGNYSLAAGRRAKANHLGAFVWADSSADADFASTAANQFLIRASGGVGIGTNSPGERLHVSGGNILLDNEGLLRWKSSGGTSKTVLQLFSDDNVYMDAIAATTSDLIFRTNTTFTERMRITDAGDVGIGTTAPTQRLHVVGNICATGTIGACSDVRFKKSITPIEGALDKVERLHGVNYQWNREKYPEFAEGKQIGFVAQEVRQVLPEVVSEGSDGTLSVDYGRLTAVLLEAMKEQQKKIEKLEEMVKDLKREGVIER